MKRAVMRRDGVFNAKRFDGSWLLKTEARNGSSTAVGCETFGLEV
jgi:hypothetical protein